MNRIRSTLKAYTGDSAQELAKQLIETCQAVHANDLERNKQMSKLGADWLFERRAKDGKKKLKVMTVCNTGSLATSVSIQSIRRLIMSETEIVSFRRVTEQLWA
jgi:methylthioribose-1-phosphate isomerase